MSEDVSKKKISFPSFKSAAKVADAAPVIQDVALAKPAPVKQPPAITTKPHKRPVRSSGGRSETELKRINDETVFDIDHRGDMDVFKYGGINEAKVPLYYGRTSDRIEEYELVPLKRVHSEPIQEHPMRICSNNTELGEYVPIPEIEDECAAEPISTGLLRQKELNEALGNDPNNFDLWIKLLDLQDDLNKDHKTLRTAILERKLAIIERAMKECNFEYWRLLSYEMKCRGEMESYDLVKARWTKILNEHHKEDASLALWNAYLDWLQSDCGLGKFSVSECLDAYSQAFESMNYEIEFEFFKRYCYFLKDIDYMERLAALLAMVLRNKFGPRVESFEDAIDWKSLKPHGKQHRNNPALSRAMNWTELELCSRRIFWAPRLAGFTGGTGSPAEPTEDYMREVVQEDLEPISIVSRPGLDDDLVRLAAELLDVKGVFSTDYQFTFEKNGQIPARFSMFNNEKKCFEDRVMFLRQLAMMNSELWESVERLRTLDPFGDTSKEVNKAEFDANELNEGSELRVLCSWHDSSCIDSKMKGIGPLVIALDLFKRDISREEYRDRVYSWLNVDFGNATLIELAWRLDGRMGFRSKFRRWLDSLEDTDADKVWPVVIRLEESSCDPNKFSSLCERALSRKSIWHNRKSIWLSYLRNGPRDPTSFKSVVYRAISDCPYCKDIYLTAIKEGLTRAALKEHEAEELVNLMEEKGIRLRHLIEEAEL